MPDETETPATSALAGFYLFHERQGHRCLKQGDLSGTRRAYAQALAFNPANDLLLYRLARHLHDHPEVCALLELLTDGVANSLRFRGARGSVFHLARAAGLVQRRIMQARLRCAASLPFALDPPDSPPNTPAPSPPPRRPRLVLLTCVWQRPALTEIVLDYYQRLQTRLAAHLELILVAVGSEGPVSRQRCTRFGFHYHEHPNQPLSAKWEQGLRHCRQHQADGVVIVGSDDLLSEALLRGYGALLAQGVLFCGFPDGVFFDLCEPSGSVHWHGYGGSSHEHGMPWRLNETIGMGRLLARPLLDWLDYSLWAGEGIDKSLDARAKERVSASGLLPLGFDEHLPVWWHGRRYLFGQLALPMARLDGLAVDIKLPGENITVLEKYQHCPEAFTRLADPWGVLERHFPAETVGQLKTLSAANGGAGAR